jgi:hypothetical protein
MQTGEIRNQYRQARKTARTSRPKHARSKAAASRRRCAAAQPTSPVNSETEGSGGTNWGWREEVVNIQGEHIEIRYGDAAKDAYDEWLPIALIGKPTNHVFPVSWLITPDNSSKQRMIDAVKKELDFYLVEKHEANPWAYAKHHCNTAANIYSKVHWSYFTNAIPGQPHSSPYKSS